jgi:hypothetical protein
MHVPTQLCSVERLRLISICLRRVRAAILTWSAISSVSKKEITRKIAKMADGQTLTAHRHGSLGGRSGGSETPHSLILPQGMVVGSQAEKCGLKYVI